MSGTVTRSGRHDGASAALATSSGGAPVASATASTTRSRMRRPPTVSKPLGRPSYRRAAPPASTAPRTSIPPSAPALQDDVQSERQRDVVVPSGLHAGRRRLLQVPQPVGGTRGALEAEQVVADFQAQLVAGPDGLRDPGRQLERRRPHLGGLLRDDLSGGDLPIAQRE